MEIAYDPMRIRDLYRRTVVSIESLTALRSTDQAANDALRAVRLTRNNLEDLWMPLLREIEDSRAMVGWLTMTLDTVHASGARLAEWFTHHATDGERLAGDVDSTEVLHGSGLDWGEFAERTNEEVLAWLAFDGDSVSRWNELFGHANTTLSEFSKDLAKRVNRDADFATSLIALAPTTPLIALATGEARFPDRFTGAVVSTMLSSPPWFSGLEAHVEAEAVQVAMSTLKRSPETTLNVLTNPDVLFALAHWPLLDTTVVQEFVTAGLGDAVLADVTRLGDGYAVLEELVQLTNGRLDGGMPVGLARGVAMSIDAYLATLAPAIGDQSAKAILVVVSEQDDIVDLGTYADLVDLFGALMRDAPSQAAVGIALGGYTIDTIDRLGENIAKHRGLRHVTQFADLLGDAAHAEQAELVMAAAADATFRRQIAGAVGAGVDLGLTLTGVGILARGVTSHAIDLATDWMSQVKPEELADRSIPSEIYDLITIATIAMVANDPAVRASVGLNGISAQSWGEIDELLENFDNSEGSDERANNMALLRKFINDDEPDLGGFIDKVRTKAGAGKMIEDRDTIVAD